MAAVDGAATATRGRVEAHRVKAPVEILCADWSLRPAKRAVAAGRPGSGWRLVPEAAPAAGWSLGGLLHRAEERAAESGRPVLVGVDAVLGVPAAFARRLGVESFFEAVAALVASGGLETHATSPSQWSPRRPFFRVPPGAGGLAGFSAAAGGPAGLLRRIDRHTGAKPVFVLSGIPGTVGSGSRALWAELAPLLREPDRRFRVWPFEGDLDALEVRPGVVLAEVYPRAAYAPALEEVLPSPLLRLAKSRPAARSEALGRLEAASWRRLHGVALGDLGPARTGEDAFDALLAAAGLVRLVSEDWPLSLDCVDTGVEGGILATGALVPRRG